jgi:hypothetical protein
MKRSMKKLTLSKETLSNQELVKVGGGGNTFLNGCSANCKGLGGGTADTQCYSLCPGAQCQP